MDKAQKELGKTYWHFRKISNERELRYKGYEMEYLVDNVPDFDPHNAHNISKLELISIRPEFQDKLVVKPMHKYDIVGSILDNPQTFDTLLNLMPNELIKLDSTDIKEIGIDHPHLLSKLPPRTFIKFNDRTNKSIIKSYPFLEDVINKAVEDVTFDDLLEDPRLLNKFDINDFESKEIRDLIIKHPKLYDDLNLYDLETDDVVKILRARPELKTYLEHLIY